MPAYRFYLDDNFSENKIFSIDGDEFQHFKVMRPQEGDLVELVNGRGGLAQASVSSIDKRSAVIKIQSSTTQSPCPFRVVIAQAIPKLPRLDVILEKGTELGMTDLWLFPGDRSEKKEVNAHQLERIYAKLIAAMKQCGRLFVPEVKLIEPISQWALFKQKLYFGDLDKKAPMLWNVLEKNEHEGGLIFCVGPESGLSKKEISRLKKIGGTGAKLHNNILRTDTAPLAALSLITHYFGHRD